MDRTYLPWMDRAGRFSRLRAAVFAAMAAPACWILFALATDRLGAEPFDAVTHLTGIWTLWFLLAALAVTPLRRLLGWGRLIGVRRMIGLGAFAYTAGHFSLYILSQNGDLAKVASEIAARIYLAVGFVTLLGLGALAATSFDRAIRRMGAGWRRLHRLAYPLTALGVLHFFMQAKIDVAAPSLLFGIWAGLMLHRAFARSGAPAALLVIGAAIAGGAATAGSEYLWHLTMSGLPAGRVFAANFDFSYEIRPLWWAMAILAAPLPLLAPKWIRPALARS